MAMQEDFAVLKSIVLGNGSMGHKYSGCNVICLVLLEILILTYYDVFALSE